MTRSIMEINWSKRQCSECYISIHELYLKTINSSFPKILLFLLFAMLLSVTVQCQAYRKCVCVCDTESRREGTELFWELIYSSKPNLACDVEVNRRCYRALQFNPRPACAITKGTEGTGMNAHTTQCGFIQSMDTQI